jgi:hypothetical protein
MIFTKLYNRFLAWQRARRIRREALSWPVVRPLPSTASHVMLLHREQEKAMKAMADEFDKWWDSVKSSPPVTHPPNVLRETERDEWPEYITEKE